jgi:hypothetical protein
MHDEDSSKKHDLVGGFYDSGNNIKFSFPTAYTVTLLSWSVIEYQQKYADIGELDHVKDIIRWGSDYLLKLFVPPNATTPAATLYSQASIHNYCTLISPFLLSLSNIQDLKTIVFFFLRNFTCPLKYHMFCNVCVFSAIFNHPTIRILGKLKRCKIYKNKNLLLIKF